MFHVSKLKKKSEFILKENASPGKRSFNTTSIFTFPEIVFFSYNIFSFNNFSS